MAERDTTAIDGYEEVKRELEILGVPQSIDAIEQTLKMLEQWIDKNILSKDQQQELLDRLEALKEKMQTLEQDIIEFYNDTKEEYVHEQGAPEQEAPEQEASYQQEETYNQFTALPPVPSHDTYADEPDYEVSDLAEQLMNMALDDEPKKDKQLYNEFGDPVGPGYFEFDKRCADAIKTAQERNAARPHVPDIDKGLDDFELAI